MAKKAKKSTNRRATAKNPLAKLLLAERVSILEQQVDELSKRLTMTQFRLSARSAAELEKEYISGRWHRRSGDIYGRTRDQARDLRSSRRGEDRH